VKRIAVMQPYFFPYAGYFRLFAAVDEFVIFDCVQFPRRGRVHRTQIPGSTIASKWLTLPLASQQREVLIKDLRFSATARAELDARLDRLPWLKAGQSDCADSIRSYLRQPLGDVTDFLEQGLRLVADTLGFDRPILRSSSLDIDPALRGQARVLAVAAAVSATHYLNSPGGTSLYDPHAFRREGVTLQFLPAYEGTFLQLLPALVTGDTTAIRNDVLKALHGGKADVGA
jgi:hypothetical protein